MANLCVTLIVLCFMICLVQSAQQTLKSNGDLQQYTTDLINGLIPKGYNKNLRPNYAGDPIRVNISILINDVSAISETEMEYKVDFYIRHYWNDHRLAYPVEHNISTVTLGREFVSNIWLPDSSFDNAKESFVHETVFSESTTLFRIKSNGDILYSTRIGLYAQCPMDLTFFPLDQQRCSIMMSSYGHISTELFYRWSEGPHGVEINSRIFLPTFRLLGFNKFETEDNLSTGSYSQLRCDIFLARSIGYYVSQVYIPAFLVVIISWVPFWLDRNDHLARVALGVTTVLTMTTLGTSTSSDFPKISYLKAIDIYLFTSFVVVFLSLIEFAIVGYYELEINNNQEQLDKLKNDTNNLRRQVFDDEKNNIESVGTERLLASNGDNIEMVQLPRSDHRPKSQQKSIQSSDKQPAKRTLIKDTSVIDQWARWIFPCTFIAFNIVYIFVLSLLVSIKGNSQLIQVKL